MQQRLVKHGGISNKIPHPILLRAAQEYALPQIKIVQPSLVICLGLATANAIRAACSLAREKTIASAIDHPFIHENILYWAQAHPGHFGQTGRNKKYSAQVQNDWQKMNR